MKPGTQLTPDQLSKLRLCADSNIGVIDSDDLRLFVGLGLVERVRFDSLSLDSDFIDLTQKGRLVLNTGSL
jgi:hypothetical protein